MKTLLSLVMVWLVPLVLPGTAVAGLIWNNGSVSSIGTNCDFTGNACPGGDTGWTIFDDFDLTDEEVVSGLTYDSYFSAGNTSDYLSTNWSIWDNDPLGVFGSLGPVASGNAVATLSSDSDSTTTFTITGLSSDLTAGTYWIGYENVVSGAAVTYDVLSNGSSLAGFEQESDDQQNQFHEAGNTVFTIEGVAPPATPEPSSFWLAGLIGAACFAKWRLKLSCRADR